MKLCIEYLHRAKFLSKSFIASTLCLSCLRTNNELSLGELIHLKCIYFSKHFAQRFAPESHHTWIKTAEYDAVFSKVLFLSVFAGNKIEENTRGVFHQNKGPGALDHERGATRLERAQVARPNFLAASP